MDNIQKLPSQSLYWFDEHSIYSQVKPVVELVQGEELYILVNDNGGPGTVDAVAAIFTRYSGLLCFKQDPYPQ